MCLKNTEIFLDNTLQDRNFVVSSDEIEEFVNVIRENLIVCSGKIPTSGRRGQEICNKMYPLTKNILVKALLVKQKLEEISTLHVFNDNFHPLRYATETKIEYLYDSLSKGEISDPDCLTLVSEMYGLAGCFAMTEEPEKWSLELLSFLQFENSEADSKAILSQIMNSTFSYYIAKYPAMLNKLHSKTKIL